MIQVNNLTKIYNKDEKSVVALNNISFTLEDSGFVFITGKSGCGKSTLMNVLGGLDNATSGEILCNGRNLITLSDKDFDNYRNSYLGFIFQDYCLIDDLNVAENILLAINLQGAKLSKEEQSEKLDNAMRSVDLDPSLKNRYVKELSGGQKQRVAIARALIKSPKLILADEPTGNLDSKTSTKILKLLKKLSKDRLVVIVSHNLDDAKLFGDRIIELSDGHIVSDVSKQEDAIDKVTVSRGVLKLPHSKQLTNNEINEINEKLKSNKIKKIRQCGNGFRKTKSIEYVASEEMHIEKQRMMLKHSLGLSTTFLKKRGMASVVTTIIIALLVFILGLCQFLMQFHAASTTSEVLQKNNEQDILLYNGFYDKNNRLNERFCVEIPEEQIAEFENSGYEGNVYKLYVNPFSFIEQYSDCEKIVPADYFTKHFIRETRGTLQCDEDYLIRRFGKDGKLDYVGDLDDKEYGIIITDFVADSMMALHYKQHFSYETIVGNYWVSRRYVNAIIKTDYKEKYAEIIQYINNVSIGLDNEHDEKYYEELIQQYISDVQKYYGLAYSINPNYGTAIKEEKPFEHTYINFGEFQLGNIKIAFDSLVTYTQTQFQVPVEVIYKPIEPNIDFRKNKDFGSQLNDGVSKASFGVADKKMLFQTTYTLKDNEIAMEYDIFNTLFGEFLGYYTEEDYYKFEPVTIKINKYDATDNKNLIFSEEVTIAKLLSTEQIVWTNADSAVIFAGSELIDVAHPLNSYVYGLYLDDVTNLDNVYDIINSHPYTVQSRVYKSIQSVGDIVQIFEELFGLMLFGIAFVSFILLINYAYGNIRKRYYEIGVLKSLGATNNNIGFVFSLQTIVVGFAICLISTIGLLTITPVINNLIAAKLLEFIKNEAIGTITVLKIDTVTILVNILVIIVVTIITCILPLLKLKKIKPKNIIVNKE